MGHEFYLRTGPCDLPGGDPGHNGDGSHIVTDVQLRHIRERHPDIAENAEEYLREAILHPDYILETDRPYTANVLKQFTVDGRGYQLVLRLKTSADPAEYKNSVITFMSVNPKRWRQYLRNRRILYKRE